MTEKLVARCCVSDRYKVDVENTEFEMACIWENNGLVAKILACLKRLWIWICGSVGDYFCFYEINSYGYQQIFRVTRAELTQRLCQFKQACAAEEQDDFDIDQYVIQCKVEIEKRFHSGFGRLNSSEKLQLLLEQFKFPEVAVPVEQPTPGVMTRIWSGLTVASQTAYRAFEASGLKDQAVQWVRTNGPEIARRGSAFALKAATTALLT